MNSFLPILPGTSRFKCYPKSALQCLSYKMAFCLHFEMGKCMLKEAWLAEAGSESGGGGGVCYCISRAAQSERLLHTQASAGLVAGLIP